MSDLSNTRVASPSRETRRCGLQLRPHLLGQSPRDDVSDHPVRFRDAVILPVLMVSITSASGLVVNINPVEDEDIRSCAILPLALGEVGLQERRVDECFSSLVLGRLVVVVFAEHGNGLLMSSY